MRVDLWLHPAGGKAAIPVHYNHILQGMIYHHLENALAQRIHQQGWSDGQRHLRFFVFSRLRGAFRRAGGQLVFTGPMALSIASPLDELLESLVTQLLRVRTLSVGEARLELGSVEVLMPPTYRRPVLLKALSPITVYSTLEAPDGRKKTYYYAPQEPEFGQQVLENLRRKIRAWTGEDILPDGAAFRPVKVSNRNLVVARYKGTVIKGWTGIYELDAPEPYFRMALDAGLGAKNSQGFGFVEVWAPKGRRREAEGMEVRSAVKKEGANSSGRSNA